MADREMAYDALIAAKDYLYTAVCEDEIESIRDNIEVAISRIEEALSLI